MTTRLIFILVCLLLSGLATPLQAKSDAGEYRQIRAGETPNLRSDRAYLLLRIDTTLGKFSANVLRVPDPEEIAAYERAKRAAHAKAGVTAGPLETFAFDYEGRPNLYELSPSKAFWKEGQTAVVLAEVMPGDYVFYGEGLRGYLWQCFCLGTVGFPAPAGEVTDLGTMIVAYAAKPSDIPELAGEVNLGPSAFMDYALFAVALRPQRPGETVPSGVPQSKVRTAGFHAVGPFIEPNTLLINRLAPMPGVLAYDAGRVIDVATGAEAKAN